MVLWRCLLAAGNVIKHCPVCLFKHICLFYDLITVPTRIRNDRLVHGHLPRTHSTSDVIVMPEGPTMFLQGISHMSLHTSSLYILQVFTLPKSHLRGQTSRTHEILASTRSSLECSKLAPLPTSRCVLLSCPVSLLPLRKRVPGNALRSSHHFWLKLEPPNWLFLLISRHLFRM